MLADFAHLEPWDRPSGCLNVVIETPKGNRNKFKYNSAHGLFELGKVLPKGMSFPYDFGFVPGTSGEDGDPLDVLILMEEPAFPGCKVRCRLIGVIEALQTNENGEAVRNDRLIAVAEESQYDKGIHSVKELPGYLMEEIGHFFESYHGVDGKEFKRLACHGPKRAEKLVKKGTKRFREAAATRRPSDGQPTFEK